MDQLFTFVANHPVLFAAFGVVLALLIANELHGNLRGGHRLAAPEAVRLINDRNALPVDLRAPGDFKRGHIINAVNAPFAKLDERLKELGKDKDRPLLLYCALGTVAPSASERLAKLGYGTVFALKGGLNGWQAAGLPVTTR